MTYTLYGTPGLLEMPSAISADDGQIAATLGYFGGQLRTSFTFQVTPRLSGTFRYAGIEEYRGEGTATFYDRSFDLRYRFNDEGTYMPAVAIGLQDFMGTGLYSGEYLVATKTIGDSFRVTAGLGWGRLGSYNGFDNPLGLISDSFYERPRGFAIGETGGTVPFDTFFRGDAALFGGVEWAPTDKLLVKVEYSSDDGYVDLNGDPLFDRASPLNFGVSWRPRPGFQLGLAYMYGSQLAFTGTLLVNPNDRLFGPGFDPAPVPVTVRPADARAAATWDRTAEPEDAIRERIGTALRRDGFVLLGLSLTETTARIRYTNGTYRSEAQGLGRVARILTGILPASIETITLEPAQRGIPLSAVTFRRTDLESLENEVGGTAAALDRAVIADAGGSAGLVPVAPTGSPFQWGIAPYVNFRLFSGSDPLKVSAGAELSARYRIAPNIILSGAIRQSVLGARTPSTFEPEALPPVRRIAGNYGIDGTPVLDHLTVAYYGRPGRNLYSRVTVGYLEPMFGGISAELLYRPVDARWAVGIEANYVAQRDSNMLFGFGNYTDDPAYADYRVATGHASFYYDFRNGFHGQIDVGRYLAGDWGATFTLDREFANGWRVGAYATFTNVSFEDFGEGSFDKGIRFTVPIDFVIGQPTRRELSNTLRSLNRDGGARLEVEGRLYETVRGGHLADLSDQWGRFWR